MGQFSYEYEQVLVQKLQKNLELLISNSKEAKHKYKQIVDKLESNNLVEEALDRLRDSYMANTNQMLDDLIQQVEEIDLTIAKRQEEAIIEMQIIAGYDDY